MLIKKRGCNLLYNYIAIEFHLCRWSLSDGLHSEGGCKGDQYEVLNTAAVAWLISAYNENNYSSADSS